MLPFTNVNGKSYTYNRENTIANGAFLSVNENVPEQASTFTQVTTTLRILAGDVDVDKFLIATMEDHNDQVAIQLAQKAKGLGMQFKQALVTGDSLAQPTCFDGMAKLVDPAQVIVAGTNGAALTLSMLDQLKDQVIQGPDAFVMRRGTFRAYKSLLRAAGGTQPPMIMLENFSGTMTPTHDGIPILVSDYIPGTDTQGTSNGNCCAIYAVRFNEVDGLHGITGGGQGGFQVESIGTVQNRDAFRYRLKWYVSMVLKSTLSMASLVGITNV
jgi:hypothetical protein